jgi:class 3 adenylate cyclase
VDRPPVAYALTHDGVHIAYQVFGNGPIDVLFVGSWFGHVDVRWEWPGYVRWFERLASFARVIVFDKRGVGASDPAPPHSITLESWVDDARAVMAAANSSQASVVVWTDATPVGLWLAATSPESVRALAIVNWSYDIFQAFQIQSVLDDWGTRAGLTRLDRLAPSMRGDRAYQEWFLRLHRASAGPGAVNAMYAMLRGIDIAPVLPLVSAPTLLVRRRDLPSSRELAQKSVDALPQATFVEVPGEDIHVWAGDVDPLIDEVEAFLTGVRPAPVVDRALLTVMFTDMVGSTPTAVRLGDSKWSELLAAHNAGVRRAIAEYAGREVLTKGDEFLVTFDGPARAVRCAQAVHAAAAELGLQMRSGLHTGEIELRGDDVAGIAVHIAARVREHAEPDEILVSRTVKDLVAGSGLTFAERGTHALKGVPDDWNLYAVT